MNELYIVDNYVIDDEHDEDHWKCHCRYEVKESEKGTVYYTNDLKQARIIVKSANSYKILVETLGNLLTLVDSVSSYIEYGWESDVAIIEESRELLKHLKSLEV